MPSSKTATIDPAVSTLEQRIANNPDDGNAHYQLAVLLLAPHAESYFWRKRAVLPRAKKLLKRAVALQPDKWNRHALLGFVYTHNTKDLGLALDAMREALRLRPNEEVLQVFIPWILADMGEEREAIKAMTDVARQQGINLRQHREELRKARIPADSDALLQAFLRPRNYFASNLWREAERLRGRIHPEIREAAERAEREDCAQRQRELRESFDRSRVPPALRPLAAAAARYGVGDDVCRPLLMKRMSRTARAKLVRQVKTLTRDVQQWLDGFEPGRMSDEAVAYMYLLQGLDELPYRSD